MAVPLPTGPHFRTAPQRFGQAGPVGLMFFRNGCRASFDSLADSQ